jgi:small subunit ribosomal protein S2
MSELNVQALIDAGAHIGCRVGRWNPKMAPYILESRHRIHIIDLRETIRGILRAKHFLREVIASGQDVLFVGTKQNLSGEIAKVKVQAGMPFVEDRWIGGTLTNYEVIGSRIAFLDEMEKKEEEGYLEKLTKKEGARFTREKRKVFRNLHGIRDMFRLPGAMVVVDPRTEYNAIREAKKMGIPVIGIVDTDCNPDVCDLVIPANDDAIRSVALIMEHLIDAINTGKGMRKERGVADPQRDPAREKKAAGVPVPRPRQGGPRRPGRLGAAAGEGEGGRDGGRGGAGKGPGGQAAPRSGPRELRQPIEGGVNRQVEIQALPDADPQPADVAPVDSQPAQVQPVETPEKAD